MNEPKADRRSRRTRRSVTSAMAELLLDKPYDDITVQDILDRADVGRSTFYHHFRDKQDVVDSVAAEMFESLGVAPPAPGGSAPFPARELFRHAQERYKSLRVMVNSGSEVFWVESEAALASGIERWISSAPAARPVPSGRPAPSGAAGSSGRLAPDVPAPIVGQFLAGAFLAVLKWWIRSAMPYPPEQMAAMFERLMPSVVGSPSRVADGRGPAS